MLTNTAYFKGTWLRRFDPGETTVEAFRLLDGTERPRPLMAQRGSYAYDEDDVAQAVWLPYAEGDVTMQVIVPKPSVPFPEFHAWLTAAGWQRSPAAHRTGTIRIPRFSLTCEADLNGALARLGMAIAFGPASDFSRMTSDVWLSRVRQNTRLEVDEEGTLSAAATAVVMTRSLASSGFELRADRPFFCALRHAPTSLVLFAGFVVDPT